MHSTSTLREWSKIGVISGVEKSNSKDLYPDIVVIEILIAVRLKEKYTLDEIAKARSYFNFENKSPYNIKKKSLLKFINFKSLFNDCNFVTKHTSKNSNSATKVKRLKNNFNESRLYLKLLDDYMDEFMRAKADLYE